MADFQKLNNDRLFQNIQRAFGSPGSKVVTNDITKGEVVEVEFDGTSNEESVNIPTRRTGAILIRASIGAASEVIPEIADTTLTIYTTGTPTGSFFFWVF